MESVLSTPTALSHVAARRTPREDGQTKAFPAFIEPSSDPLGGQFERDVMFVATSSFASSGHLEPFSPASQHLALCLCPESDLSTKWSPRWHWRACLLLYGSASETTDPLPSPSTATSLSAGRGEVVSLRLFADRRHRSRAGDPLEVDTLQRLIPGHRQHNNKFSCGPTVWPFELCPYPSKSQAIAWAVSWNAMLCCQLE